MSDQVKFVGGYIYVYDQVKFVGVHREREKNGGGVMSYIMSNQVKFVGVHRERERFRKKEERGGLK